MGRYRLFMEGCYMAKGKIEKRGAKRRKVKPIVLIVTEGSQTEPKYFEHFASSKIMLI